MLVPRVIADAGDQRRAALPRILRRHHPQQEHPHGLLPRRRAVLRLVRPITTIGELADIEPLHVAAYIEALGKDFEKPTVKQHLAAIRMLFDCGGAFDRGCGHVAAKSMRYPNQFHKR